MNYRQGTSRLCWRVVNIASRLLEPEERDAVGGDLAECGETAGQALWGVLGLVMRRQLALWHNWRPWLALFGIIGVSGLFLDRVRIQLQLVLFDWLTGFSNFRTPSQDIIHLVSLSGALLVWSWASGFTLGSLSGRATWLTGLLFCLAANIFWVRLLPIATRPDVSVPAEVSVAIIRTAIATTLLFLLPAFSGMSEGARRRTLGVRQALMLTAAIIALTVLVTWTSGFYENNREALGGYRAIPWQVRLLPLAVLSWPAGYMIATAFRRRRQDRITFNEVPRDA